MPGELIIDASLSKRLAAELRTRGRPSRSVSQFGIQEYEDQDLLPFLLDALQGQWVLVTGDDAMPAAHGDLIAELGVTVATVDPRWKEAGWTHQEAWKRETVHRWAHKMAAQTQAELRRYSPAAHRTWRPLSR